MICLKCNKIFSVFLLCVTHKILQCTNCHSGVEINLPDNTIYEYYIHLEHYSIFSNKKEYPCTSLYKYKNGASSLICHLDFFIQINSLNEIPSVINKILNLKAFI